MTWEECFEQAWAKREERIYRDLFGPDSGGIYALDASIFSPFYKGEIDPRWLTHGVIKFPPNAQRDTWIYATSGLSNAWFDSEANPAGWSGLGCELVMETAEDSGWAIGLMRQLLAYQILLGWGIFEGKEPLVPGDRVPFGRPIDNQQSALTWCLFAPPSGYLAEFPLPTGRAEFFHIVGITDAEAAFLREHEYEDLLKKLAPVGYPVTRIERRSAV